MRPIRLVAEGFSAFRERVEIDFTGVDFFVLVGPTGAGKSSVIDAICFALYGSVPRYEDERAVAPVITIGALEAKVSLTFEVAGEVFTATRVVRRQAKGPGATTREARLERIGGEQPEVLAGNADELSREVEKRLGLVFKHFTRCVVLPQGEFARFLHDKPAERQSLLVNLLDIEIYNRIGQRARALADMLKSRIALHDQRIEALAFATAGAEIEARQRVDALAAVRAEIGVATSEIDALASAARQSSSASAEAGRLATLLERIVIPPEVAGAAAKLREFEAAVGVAEAAADLAAVRRREVESAAGSLPDLGLLVTAEAAHNEAASLAAASASAATAASTARMIAGSARIPAEAAEAAEDEAQVALEALRRTHSAVELAEHLRVGEDCPVCLQPVARLPVRPRPAGLAQAEAALLRASETKRSASKTLADADRKLVAASTEEEMLARQRDEAVARTAAYPDPERLTALIAEVRSRQGELAEARRDEESARDKLGDASRTAAEVRNALEGSWRVFDGQRDSVGALSPPQPDRRDLLTEWTALAEWAAAERPAQLESAELEGRAATSTEREIRQQLATLAATCAGVGVEPAAAARGAESVAASEAATVLSAMREAVVVAATDAAHMLRSIVEGLAELERLLAERETVAGEAGVAQMLGNQLTATGFQRWLVAEALDLLVDGASETLRRLSADQYSLSRDDRNEFVVIDHRNADERRSAKSLSGGETFQASLALALALADQLAGLSTAGAARLESIFLDEGFGTLDPETLSVVADAIESLGSEERMVGVVTHVRELAERVPVRFEVRKGSRTSTVERLSG